MEQRKRIITAAICIPLFLLMIYFGGLWLGIPLILLGILGIIEYYRMLKVINPQALLLWMILGLAYIVLGFLAFFGTKIQGATLWLLLIIWSTDIAAYEIGRRFGRTPLAPSLSPNKTIEGSIAGLVAGLIIGMLYGLIFMKAGFWSSLLIPLVISAIGQVGDLLESKVKRMAGVKDSGSIFPGHGGVLDRFDSLMLAAPFMYFFMVLIR